MNTQSHLFSGAKAKDKAKHGNMSSFLMLLNTTCVGMGVGVRTRFPPISVLEHQVPNDSLTRSSDLDFNKRKRLKGEQPEVYEKT